MGDTITKAKRVHRAREIPDIDTLPRTALLTRGQVCKLSNFSLPTLKNWAATGRGPTVTLIEGRPRYAAGDVLDWLAGCRVIPTRDVWYEPRPALEARA